MKTKLFLLLLLCPAVILLNSCKKDTPHQITVTDEDAVDLLSNTFSSETFGIASQIDQEAKIAELYLHPAYCNFTGDSTIHKTYDGIAIYYNVAFTWNWTMMCSNDSITSMGATYLSTGSDTTTDLITTFTADGNISIYGLPAAYNNYIFNGTYNQSGNMASKINKNTSFSYVLNITCSNINMSKGTYMINEGSAPFTLSCTTPDNHNYFFSGTISFDDNKSCSVVLDGKTYTFQI